VRHRGRCAAIAPTLFPSATDADALYDVVTCALTDGPGGNLRHHLRRGVGMSPSSYRKVYQGA
jgi:hypothetical protein